MPAASPRRLSDSSTLAVRRLITAHDMCAGQPGSLPLAHGHVVSSIAAPFSVIVPLSSAVRSSHPSGGTG